MVNLALVSVAYVRRATVYFLDRQQYSERQSEALMCSLQDIYSPSLGGGWG